MGHIKYKYSELAIGMKSTLTRTVTDKDVMDFAHLIGDTNPIHVDDEFAEASMFGRRIVHGMFGAGLISAVLGTQLPGPGNVYMDQSLRFMKPVFIGDTMTVTVEITELIAEKHRVRLSTVCTNQDGVTVIQGEALLYFKGA